LELATPFLGVLGYAPGMRGFRKLEKVSTWRRLAVHAWDAPKDPTVYGIVEIDATEALSFIDELRTRSGVKVTITHLVGHAVACAIKARPEVNAIVRFGSLYQRETVDVFFQVAFEGGENLAGHKVERADEKSVVDIARELGQGAGKVRSGEAENVKASKKFRAIPAPLLGLLMKATTFATYDLGLDLTALGVPYDGFGSVMVTNVGSFGLSVGLPPVLPFSRCPLLLLVGEVQQRAVVHNGVVVARPVLPLGVTFDHRLLDGYQASVLAKAFRNVMEHPREALAQELSRLPTTGATGHAPLRAP
jgi:pyruvate/2-oxoglutarate dehydrogenase complex dihydrolipoamide acyltransferase (E2) component